MTALGINLNSTPPVMISSFSTSSSSSSSSSSQITGGRVQTWLFKGAQELSSTFLKKSVTYALNPQEAEEQRNAFIAAVTQGDVEAAKVSLKKGIYPNMRIGGFTPLYLACDKGNYDMADLLLKHGADVHMKNKVLNPKNSRDLEIYEAKPIDVAIAKQNFKILDLLRAHGVSDISQHLLGAIIANKIALALYFISTGAKIDIHAHHKPLLTLAVELEQRAVVEALIARGAPVGELYDAGLRDFFAIPMEELLETPAWTDGRPFCEGDFTCLHIAAKKNKPDILAFLLENGAAKVINSRTRYDKRTPLYYAVEEGMVDNVVLLVNAHADLTFTYNISEKQTMNIFEFAKYQCILNPYDSEKTLLVRKRIVEVLEKHRTTIL